MPMRITVRLRALADCVLSPAHGEQTHAAFFTLLSSADEQLAIVLHDRQGDRPYVIGMVGGWGSDGRRRLREGQIVSWPLSLLDDEIAAVVWHALACLPIGEAGELHIGPGRFAVESSSNRAQDGGCRASFADLLEAGARQSNRNVVDLALVTPLAFSLGEQEWGKRIELFPLPELVYGSLIRRWTQYAPPECVLSPDLAEWVKRNVVVARYNLRTVAISGSKGPQLGSIGTVSYKAMATGDSALMAQWQALVEFASFSAIGYRTTMGWGQVQRLASVPPPGGERQPAARRTEEGSNDGDHS